MLDPRGLEDWKVGDHMTIEKGTSDDMKAVMKLIQAVIRDMESRGIHQWNEYYPTANDFEGDIRKNSLFLLRSKDGLLGVIAFDEDQAPEYGQVDWSIKDDRALVIHRLAVAPEHQGKGYAGELMAHAETYAREHGYASIRLDAYSGNPGTLRFYEKRGYVKVGEIHFPWRELPFHCYERVL